MNFIRTEISEVVICEPRVFEDDRGYFFESFKRELFEEFIGFKVDFCQDNESKSTKGVFRGLHYQLPPFAQSKLVRVIKGEVLDVAVDIRKDSPTFGKHVTVTLSENNKRQLFLPRGFAHGFLVLSDEAIFSYKVDNIYAPESDRGIMYNDKELNINWSSHLDLILSEKDKNLSSFGEADTFDYNQELYD